MKPISKHHYQQSASAYCTIYQWNYHITFCSFDPCVIWITHGDFYFLLGCVGSSVEVFAWSSRAQPGFECWWFGVLDFPALNSAEGDNLSPFDSSAEGDNLSPLDSSAEGDNLSPFDSSAEGDNLSPFDSSVEGDNFSPFDSKMACLCVCVL